MCIVNVSGIPDALRIAKPESQLLFSARRETQVTNYGSFY